MSSRPAHRHPLDVIAVNLLFLTALRYTSQDRRLLALKDVRVSIARLAPAGRDDGRPRPTKAVAAAATQTAAADDIGTRTKETKGKKKKKKKKEKEEEEEKSWAPLCLAEWYVFVGILIVMGYHRVPEVRHYWSKSGDVGVKVVRTAMPYKRFMQIWKAFHYSNQPSYKRLRHMRGATTAASASRLQAIEREQDAMVKVRFFCSLVNRQFRRCRNPGRDLCVDESMTAFTGRSRVKVDASLYR